jgi:ADP-ribose pyrophosphatase YjhB (NUDIX family)
VAGDSRRLVGLLAETDRLKVVSALALGATGPGAVIEATGLDPKTVAAALRRLELGGLVSTVDGELRLLADQFRTAARAESPPAPAEDFGVSDPAAAGVLRAFVRDGRLTQIPAARAKRQVVLEHIASTFEPGRRYPEKQVNALLQAWHPDYAALRRYLVDELLLSREAGVYWRSGGWVDVSDERPAGDAAARAGAGAAAGDGGATAADVAAGVAVAGAAVGAAAGGVAAGGVAAGGAAALEEAAGVAGVDVAAGAAEAARELIRDQRVAAYALVVGEPGEVLLTRYSRGPDRGMWALPGGGVDFGERPADAVVREVYEETGLHVRVAELLDVDSDRYEIERRGRRYDAHPVRVLYRVEVTGGTLGVTEVGGSTDEVRWFARDTLDPGTLSDWVPNALRYGRFRA